MERRKFLKCVSVGGVALGGMCPAVMAKDQPHRTAAGGKWPSLTLRPYQLLCVVCSIGEEGGTRGGEKLRRIHEAIRENPDIPVKLVCNCGDVFVYQDPGSEDDSDSSPDFNRKRDLEVLQRLDLPPGITLPARIILHRLWDRIESVSGICGYNEMISEAWKGCPKAKSGCYEKGRKKGISVLIPARTQEEMVREKEKSLKAMREADAIAVRPHILLCAVCQYGGGTRPPYPPDNLPEMLQFVLKNPNAKIKMAEAADWMMCGPCPNRAPGLNACVNVKGSGGLTNQLRDANTLWKLGLRHGDVVNARELYRRIFERIPDTAEICAVSKGVHAPSVWWDSCGERNVKEGGTAAYVKGRELLAREFGFNKQPS